MIHIFARAALAAITLCYFTLSAAVADPIQIGDLVIDGTFSRAMLPGAKVGGGYLSVTNKGKTADRLVSATSPIAQMVQLHEMKMVGEVMQMRELPNGIDIPAGETVSLAPGGTHLMFMNIQTPFVQGAKVPVTLTFEKAGSVDIELPVAGIAADAPPMAGMKM